jgi:signal transduction histidine kinase
VTAATDPPVEPPARARALLDAALEASADALLVTDGAGRAEAGNRRFLALFGLAPGDLAAPGAAPLWHRLASRCRDAAAVAARFESMQSSPEPATDGIELLDGRRFECFAQPVAHAGQRLGRVWRFREIAAPTAVAPASPAEAARTLRLKEELLSSLSHALRTPLGAVLGWAKTLQLRRQDAATLERGLDAIGRNAELQARLLETIVDADHVLSGKVQIETQPLDLAELVAAAVEAARPAADAKGLALAATLDRSAGPVAADADRLRQVVASLLANAIAFTPRGGRIEVLLQPPGDRMELVVRDDGIGIDAARLLRVFERHDPADPASTRSRTGLGLSMPVARRLVELHGGSIEAASAGSGRGATFTVRLPLLAPTRAPAES